MDIIKLFTRLLESQSEKPSKTTVKNYRADLNHFISWYEKTYGTDFSPEKINAEILTHYSNTSNLAYKSLKRHLSSIKKFYALLEEKNYSHNPFQQKNKKEEDSFYLSDFTNFLSKKGNSKITVKNYTSDIRAFIAWAQKVSLIATNIQTILKPTFLEEYKLRLHQTGTPHTTINRKLSSLRKYQDYARQAGLIKNTAYQTNISAAKNTGNIRLQDLNRFKPEQKNFSKFPPIRLFQKVLTPYFQLEDAFAEKIAEKLHRHNLLEKKDESKETKNSFITYPEYTSISNLKSTLFVPLTISENDALHKKVLHHARYTRPNWYKKYHALSASHYIHFALLIVFSLMIGFVVYHSTIGEALSKNKTFTTSGASSKILSFRGKLTDEKDIPISEPKTVYFNLYNNDSKPDSKPLWQESQIIEPEEDGSFTTYLGTKSPLSTKIFQELDSIYLGVKIDGQEELRPRQRLANIAYAANTQLLQGMSPVTEDGAGTKNVVLTLNSQGNLAIGGNAGTTFQTTGGNFKLSGEGLTIQTNEGSNEDITLSPDGTGKIDIHTSLSNTSDSGDIWPGAVVIEDQAVVSATTSAKPAFTLLQNGTGNIFTASSADGTQVVIDNKGRMGVGVDNPTERLHVDGNIRLEGQNPNIYGRNLNIYSRGTSDLLLQSSSQSVGNVGIGTTSPNAFVEIEASTLGGPLLQLNYTGSGQNILTAQNSGEDVFTLGENGNVGIGTTSTTSRINLPHSTSRTGGISFGDSNLYRSTPRTLKTNASFEVGGDITVDGTTTFNSNTYTWPHAEGTNGQVLTTNGTGKLSWTTLDTTDFWQKDEGALFSRQLTDDILVGSNATSSALVRLPGTTGEDSWFNTGGNVGIGTSTPQQKFEVEGDIRLDLNGNATTNGVCHSGSNSDTTASNRDLVVCSDAPADIAEWYAAGNTVEAGHIVQLSENSLNYEARGANPETGIVASLGTQEINILEKANSAEKALGVISTAPYQTIGSDIKKSLEDNESIKAVPVALAGRVLLKIARTSTQIKAGDPITVSEFAGKGKKAEDSTFIVGRALESWNKDKEEILIYIQPTWHQNITLKDNGQTNIKIVRGTDSYEAEMNGNLIENTQAAAQFISGRIETGALRAREAVVETTLKTGELVATRISAGALEAKKITTDSLELTSSSLTIAGKSLQEYIDERVTKIVREKNESRENSETNSDTISPLAQSGASKSANLDIEGEISTQSLNSEYLESQTASISGTFTADTIIANQIEGLEEKIASQAAQPTHTQEINFDEVEVDENGLTQLPSFQANYAIFSEGFTSFGPATFGEITATEELTLGTNFRLTENSLNTLNDTLEIQPLRQAPISFMGGEIVIDTSGNLTVNGNTILEGTLIGKNAIFENGLITSKIETGVISPIPENDLALRLSKKKDGSSQKFQVQNASGAAVLTIDDKGDIESSGAATFSKLNLRIAGEAEAVSENEIRTTGSAGKAQINAFQKELTVYNENVTEDSLIYITPVSNTDNTIHLIRQKPEESFTVGISTPSEEDVEFNWLIVN